MCTFHQGIVSKRICVCYFYTKHTHVTTEGRKCPCFIYYINTKTFYSFVFWNIFCLMISLHGLKKYSRNSKYFYNTYNDVFVMNIHGLMFIILATFYASVPPKKRISHTCKLCLISFFCNRKNVNTKCMSSYYQYLWKKGFF